MSRERTERGEVVTRKVSLFVSITGLCRSPTGKCCLSLLVIRIVERDEQASSDICTPIGQSRRRSIFIDLLVRDEDISLFEQRTNRTRRLQSLVSYTQPTMATLPRRPSMEWYAAGENIIFRGRR